MKGPGKPTSDAHDISYWNNGHVFVAEYSTAEASLRKRYPNFTFVEITNSVPFPRYTYGDPMHLPFKLPSRAPPIPVTNGVRYRIVWSNGGGYDIIFNRETGRVFINMAAR